MFKSASSINHMGLTSRIKFRYVEVVLGCAGVIERSSL